MDLAAVELSGEYEGRGDAARVADELQTLQVQATRRINTRRVFLWVGVVGLPLAFLVIGAIPVSQRGSDTEWMIAACCWFNGVAIAVVSALLYWFALRRKLLHERIRFARCLFSSLQMDPVRPVSLRLRFTPTERAEKTSSRPNWSHEDSWFRLSGHLVDECELDVQKTELLGVSTTANRTWMSEDRFRLAPNASGARRLNALGKNPSIAMPAHVTSSDATCREGSLEATVRSKFFGKKSAPSSGNHIQLARATLEVLDSLHQHLRTPTSEVPWTRPRRSATVSDERKRSSSSRKKKATRPVGRIAAAAPFLLTLACILPLDLAACGGYCLDEASYFAARRDRAAERIRGAARCRETRSTSYNCRPDVIAEAPRQRDESGRKARSYRIFGFMAVGIGLFLELFALTAIGLRWRRRRKTNG